MSVLNVVTIVDAVGNVEASALPSVEDPQRVLAAQALLVLFDDPYAQASDVANYLNDWLDGAFRAEDESHWDLVELAMRAAGPDSLTDENRQFLDAKMRDNPAAVKFGLRTTATALVNCGASTPARVSVRRYLRRTHGNSSLCQDVQQVPRSADARRFATISPIEPVVLLDALQTSPPFISGHRSADRLVSALVEVSKAWLADSSGALTLSEIANLTRVVTSHTGALPELPMPARELLRATVFLAGRTVDQGQPYAVADSVSLVAVWRLAGRELNLSRGAGDNTPRDRLLDAWNVLLDGRTPEFHDVRTVRHLGIAGMATEAAIRLKARKSPCGAGEETAPLSNVANEISTDGAAFWALILAELVKECAPTQSDELAEAARDASKNASPLTSSWISYQASCIEGSTPPRPIHIDPDFDSTGELGAGTELLAVAMSRREFDRPQCRSVASELLRLE